MQKVFQNSRTQMKKEWTRRGSNPGPSACEADVIPLHHKPVIIFAPASCWMAF